LTPVVSVILPVYNGEQFLADAIDSILDQEFKDFELILIDDCSTDSSPAICQSYVQRDNRVAYHRNEQNLKLPASLNKGHRLAKGQYLTWSSDDNILYPNNLSVLASVLRKGKSDLVYSAMRNIEADGTVRRIVPAANPVKSLFGSVVGASFMYTREVFEKLKGYDESKYLIEDFDFWLRASIYFKLSPVEECLYDYRIHPGSLSQKIADDSQFKAEFEQRLEESYGILMSELDFASCTIDFLISVHLYQNTTFSIFQKDISHIIQDLKRYCNHMGEDFSEIQPFIINSIRTTWVQDKSLMTRPVLFKVLRHYPQVLFSRRVYHMNTLKIISNSLISS
jgi:glycosyltransferase involved in cell wall biosynthesis